MPRGVFTIHKVCNQIFYPSNRALPGLASTMERIRKSRWEYHINRTRATFAAALERARRIAFLRLSAAVIAEPSKWQDDPPCADDTGDGLASAFIASTTTT